VNHENSPKAALGKIGLEIELMAPPGKSRKDLADAIASRLGGKVRRFFHPQGEPSKVPNTPVFENLTLGFLVEDSQGNILAQCVDDLTLQDDLKQAHPPIPGWYRIVSDDARFLRLGMRHMDASAPLETVLDPLAALFGSTPQLGQGGMYRVGDDHGTPIAMGAPLPGERERPCELVSAPISENHLEQLEALLAPARELGFTIPAEGAIHIHFDAAPLCSAATFANLVRFLGIYSDAIRERFATNPNCRRLGRWPVEIFEVITSEGFTELDWEAARKKLSAVKLIKYCDFNLFNMVQSLSGKHTFEVRIFPVWMESEKIIEAASFFSAILDWAKDNGGKLKPVPEEFLGLKGITGE
jgi:hypothetical protein